MVAILIITILNIFLWDNGNMHALATTNRAKSLFGRSNFNDNAVESDEHHKIIILVPQLLQSENAAKRRPPKTHGHKVVPVVHSGKVIHAHHIHGKVDHSHSHAAKVKHHHNHLANSDHKHHHQGSGIINHNHIEKSVHDRKHKHKHNGQVTYNHGDYIRKLIAPAPPPSQLFHKRTSSLTGQHNAAPIFSPRRPTAFVAHYPPPSVNNIERSSGDLNDQTDAKLIRIHIPTDEENFFNQIEIDAESDLPVLLKRNYVSPDSDSGEYTKIDDNTVDYFMKNFVNGAGAGAGAGAGGSDSGEKDDTVQYPAFSRPLTLTNNNNNNHNADSNNNIIAYSDTFHYRY